MVGEPPEVCLYSVGSSLAHDDCEPLCPVVEEVLELEEDCRSSTACVGLGLRLWLGKMSCKGGWGAGGAALLHSRRVRFRG
jgi:hypothetical protein